MNYWAFGANPNGYDIVGAVRDLDTDLWTIKRSRVRAGDRVVIWKLKGRRGECRGVIGLGEVLTDPELRMDDDNPYWLDRSASRTRELRVVVRYVRPPGLPLWDDESVYSVLADLSISRAKGGTIFKVTPEQWDAVLAVAGGWPSAAPEASDTEAAVAEGTGKARCGQGFQVQAEPRRVV